MNATKVGHSLADAIFASPNNTCRFVDSVRNGVMVHRGPTLDGLGKYLTGVVEESKDPVDDVAAILKRTETDIMVCYLPVGSQRAAEWYAEQALAAGCGFVNCIPVFIASDERWRNRFAAEIGRAHV